MKWGNYIKRTAVRRVVWVVVGLVVYSLLSVFGVARAQSAPDYSMCFSTAGNAGTLRWCPDEGSAHAGAQAHAERLAGSNGELCEFTYTHHNTSFGPSTRVRANYVQGAARSCNDGFNPTGSVQREFLRGNLCIHRESLQGNFNTSLESITPRYCVQGCMMQAGNPLCTLVEEGPTAGYWCNVEYSPTGGTCSESDPDIPNDPNAPEECAIGEVRLPTGDCSPRGNCPVGQHEVDGVCNPTGACPAGSSKAPDGSCVPQQCSAGQAMGADGTCKEDSNNDGTPDEDEDGGDGTNKDGLHFSGGESCDVPPTCSGDAIMCGQARIQWRIDCNTRRNVSVHGGMACGPGNVPICTGEKCDDIERVNLVNQWKAACALQDLAGEGGDGGDGGDGDMSGVEERLDGIANFLHGDGDCMATEEGCGEGGDDHWIDGDDVEASEWSSGLASTGSCPAPISRTISLGQHVQDIEFSYQPLCDFAALLRWVLITAATILSALLIGGFRSNA